MSAFDSREAHAAEPPEIAGGRPGFVEALAVTALYLAATLAYVMPFMGDPRGTLGPDLGDPRLNLYFLQWGAHQIAQGLPDLWNAPFFHPTAGTLAISDHLLGPAAQTLALGALGVDAPTCYNLLFLSSFVLGGLATWALLRRAGLGFGGALLGGGLFAFAHARWDEASHLQILISQWLPAALLAWDRLLDQPGWRRGLLFLGFYVLQVSSGVYLAVLMHFGLAASTLARGRELIARARGGRLAHRPLVATALVCSAALLPTAFGYVERDSSLRTPAPRTQLRQHGATVASFVTPSRHSPLDRLGIFPSPGRGSLFLGFTASLLALYGLSAVANRAPRPLDWTPGRRWAVGFGAGIATAGLALGDLRTLRAEPLTLGPGGPRLGYHAAALLVLAGGTLACKAFARARRDAPLLTALSTPQRGLIATGATGLALSLPMTWALVQDLAPPLGSMRVSHRSFVLALPAIGWLAGRGLERLRSRFPLGTRRTLAMAAALGLVALELQPRLPPWTPIPVTPADLPAYVLYLRDAGEVRGYVELPFRPGWRETERMHLQTWHWRPLVNGYSAVIPPAYWEIGRIFDPMPNRAGLDRLLALGVSHIVVHEESERPRLRRRIRRWIRSAVADGDVREAFHAGPIMVLAIQPAAEAIPAAAATPPRIASR